MSPDLNAANCFEPDTRVFIGDSLVQERPCLGNTLSPFTKHANGGRPNPWVGRFPHDPQLFLIDGGERMS